MLLSVLTIQQEPGVMERRFGFRALRPLDGDGGRERFGLIERADGMPAAVLTLHGRGPAEPGAKLVAGVDALADALPDGPVQFLLSRRPLDPASLLSRWRGGIEGHSELGVAAGRVWADLQSSYLPALQRAGLADLWCGVVVTAPDVERLTVEMARLFTRLPYAVVPADSAALGVLVGRLLRPGDPAGAGRAFPLGGERVLDLPGLAPRSLLIGNDAVAFTPETVTTYWQITPPLPRVEGGWLRRLLEFPDLLPYSYDLSIHLRPAAAEETMRAVLDTRLLRLETEIATRGGAPVGAPAPTAPAAATDLWLLELERREVAERRTSLSVGRERLRDATVLLALHLPTDGSDSAARRPQAGAGATAFAAALAAAEIPARPVHGRPALSRAVRAGLPLADAGDGRAFPVAARQAAELALLPGTVAAAGPRAGLLGLTQEKTPFRYTPPLDAPDGRLLAGGGAAVRRAVARQWALETSLAGADLRVWDPTGAWAGWVQALGGRYVRPGGPLPTDRLNLLAAPLGALDDSEFFTAWVREIGTLFSLILPPLTGQDTDAVRSQIGAALLQVGMRSLDRGDRTGLSLDALQAELQAGGYRASAAGLAAIAAGPMGNLFSPEVFAADSPALVALGPPDNLRPQPGALAARIALRHALWAESALFGLPRPALTRTVLLLDGVTEALKHAYLAADLLAAGVALVPRIHLWLLPTDDELAPLLAHPAGRALVRPTGLYTLFGPAAGPVLEVPPGLAALITLMGLAGPLAARLPLLAADEAIIQTAAGGSVVQVVTGTLARL